MIREKVGALRGMFYRGMNLIKFANSVPLLRGGEQALTGDLSWLSPGRPVKKEGLWGHSVKPCHGSYDVQYITKLATDAQDQSVKPSEVGAGLAPARRFIRIGPMGDRKGRPYI